MIMAREKIIELAKQLGLEINEAALSSKAYNVSITKDQNKLEEYLTSFKIVKNVKYKAGARLYLIKEEEIEEYTICKNILRNKTNLSIPYIIYSVGEKPNINVSYDINQIYIIKKTSYKEESISKKESIIIYDPNSRVGELRENE